MNTVTLPAFPDMADAFRRVWRGFGGSVALIATEHEGERYAMLATAVASVSMEPPSLMICVNRSATAYKALTARGAFSLGIMGAGNAEIALSIARGKGPERFRLGTWNRHGTESDITDGLPWLKEAQATLFCSHDTSMDYGTHTIFVARVVFIIPSETTDPLLYCDGHYGRFSPLSALT